MTEEKKIEEKKAVVVKSQNDTQKDVKVGENKDVKKFEKKPFNKKRSFGGNRKNFKREKPEFEQRIVSFRRVTRVMAGGRRFSFSVAMVIGNKKGVAGFGLGKAQDTALAIEKAFRSAKKNLIKVRLNEDFSVPFDVTGKYKASKVMIRPVKGKGLAAGGAVRTFLELAGIDETGAKLLSRSKNNINNVKATMIALEPFSKKHIYIEKKKFPTRDNRRGGRRPFNKDKKPFIKRTFNAKKAENTSVVVEKKSIESKKEVPVSKES